jgi:hypothetical protein
MKLPQIIILELSNNEWKIPEHLIPILEELKIIENGKLQENMFETFLTQYYHVLIKNPKSVSYVRNR